MMRRMVEKSSTTRNFRSLLTASSPDYACALDARRRANPPAAPSVARAPGRAAGRRAIPSPSTPRRSPSGSVRRCSTATSPAARAPAGRRSPARARRGTARPRSPRNGSADPAAVAAVVSSRLARRQLAASCTMEWYSSSDTPMRSAISTSRASRPVAPLDLLHHRRHRARLAMHRARRPVELAQRIDHRAANADARVRLEARAAVGGVVATPPPATRACRPGSDHRPPPTAAIGPPGGRRCASPARRAA